MREDLENRIDDYFRSGLDNLNVIPPVEVWNNIAGKLPEKKSNRKLFLWIAVAASVSLFAAVSGWNYLQKNEKNSTENIAVLVQKEKSNNDSVKKSDFKTAKTNNPSIHRNSDDTPAQETEIPIASSVKPDNSGENSYPQDTNANSLELVAKPATENKSSEFSEVYNADKAPVELAAAIELKEFETPFIYGRVQSGSINVKFDTAAFFNNLYAFEDVTETKEKVNRWAIGGQMAPLYSYRNISEVNAPGISKSSINQVEKAVITYASGVLVDYEASSRLTFQTGVYYMKMGQEINNIASLTHPKSAQLNNYKAELSNGNNSLRTATANSTGTIVAASPELYLSNSATYDLVMYAPGNMASKPLDLSRKDIEQSFEFIEVPFLAKYKIFDRKINLHLLGGVSTHVLVNNKTKLVSDDNITKYGKTTDVETFNYSSSVGFGVVYKLRKNLLFSVEPTFKYYLNSFNSSDAVELHPYAFGLYSGVSFKF